MDLDKQISKLQKDLELAYSKTLSTPDKTKHIQELRDIFEQELEETIKLSQIKFMENELEFITSKKITEEK